MENIKVKKMVIKNNLEKQKNLIKVIALAKYYGNDKAGLFVVVEFKDVDNLKVKLMIPASIVNQLHKLKTLLVDKGFSYSLPNNTWKDIQKILSKEPAGRMQLVEKPGFHNGVFLQSNNKIIGSIEEGEYPPILDPASRIPFPSVERKGKLEAWKTNIAESALYSSRIMLSITSAFSSYLLWITGTESGGFHIHGTSSTGKTTCQCAAQSVQGAQESIESWSITETGAEELAAGHNDQLLVLDELGNLDSDPVKAAQKATKIIYTFTFGKDKRRSVNYTGDRLNWRISFLSTGERSLTEHAVEGGAIRMQGEEVRLIDVPADAGKGLGIYERLPKDISAAQYSDNLKAHSKEYYGTAHSD
jgi:putative DNA primase/helicase